MSYSNTINKTIALACCVAGLTLAACGGSKGSTTSGVASTGTATTEASPAERAQACAFASEANTRYLAALGRMGLKLTNKPLVDATIVTIHELRYRLGLLESKVSPAEARQLAALAAALNQQAVVIGDISVGQIATATAAGKGLNEALEKTRPSLPRICTKL